MKSERGSLTLGCYRSSPPASLSCLPTSARRSPKNDLQRTFRPLPPEASTSQTAAEGTIGASSDGNSRVRHEASVAEPLGPLSDSVSGRHSNLQFFRDPAPGTPLSAQCGNPSGIHNNSRAPEPLALGTGIPQARSDAFLDQRPLKFRHRRDDVEHQPAGGRAQ